MHLWQKLKRPTLIGPLCIQYQYYWIQYDNFARQCGNRTEV